MTRATWETGPERNDFRESFPRRAPCARAIPLPVTSYTRGLVAPRVRRTFRNVTLVFPSDPIARPHSCRVARRTRRRSRALAPLSRLVRDLSASWLHFGINSSVSLSGKWLSDIAFIAVHIVLNPQVSAGTRTQLVRASAWLNKKRIKKREEEEITRKATCVLERTAAVPLEPVDDDDTTHSHDGPCHTENDRLRITLAPMRRRQMRTRWYARRGKGNAQAASSRQAGSADAGAMHVRGG